MGLELYVLGQHVLKDVRSARTCQLVATIWVFYDHITTLDQEIELVWKKRWSLSKALFLWNRYYGDALVLADAIVFFLPSVSQPFCNTWLRSQGWCSTVLIWSMQAIMQFRIYAMFQQSHNVVMFMFVGFIVEITVTSIILARSYTGLRVMVVTIPGNSAEICVPVRVDKLFSSVWLPIICFECVLLVLALWIGFKHMRELRLIGRWNGDTVLNVLMRDSIFYFCAIFAAYSTNALIWFIHPPSWLEIPFGFSMAATVIMGCRLLLNIREACYEAKPPDEENELDARITPPRAFSRPVDLMPHTFPWSLPGKDDSTSPDPDWETRSARSLGHPVNREHNDIPVEDNETWIWDDRLAEDRMIASEGGCSHKSQERKDRSSTSSSYVFMAI